VLGSARRIVSEKRKRKRQRQGEGGRERERESNPENASILDGGKNILR